MSNHNYDYLLNIETIGDGTVVSTSNKGYQPKGGLVTLKAIASTGARFVRWQGDVAGSHHVCNLRITSSTTVVAVFENTRTENSTTLNNSAWQIKSSEAALNITKSTLSIAPIKDPAGRFLIYAHKILDLKTGLIWMTKTFSNINHADVYFGELADLQSDGWRLPTIGELKSIMHLHRKPCLKLERGYYWSCEIEESGNFINWARIISSQGSMGHGNLLTSRNHVKLVRLSEFFPIKSSTSGEGIGGILHRILTGANNSNLKDNEYFKGSSIQCTAIPENGSFFKRWHGDLESTQNPCVVTVDAAKSITAEFDFITYPITLKIIGSGMGAITPSIQADAYPHGTVLALTATATADSRLKQWSGDASGTNPDTTLTIDGSKSVTVEFVQIYPLCTSTTGQGQGMVQRSVQADAYDVDSVVQLTAIPTEGHLFVGWQGDASGKQPTCSVHMDSAKVVSAEFVSKPSFNVDVACVGTGSGVVLPAIQTHYQGSVVGLVAKAEIGSIFDGWEGSVSGFEPRCSVTVNADLEITARFSRIEIPETDISVVFDGVDSYTSTGGYEATVLLFNVSNQSERQIRIDVPLADYVTLHGEEVTQLAWQKGMINGGQGSTLRSGAFRKMGLVFDQRRLPTLQAGEHLHLTLQQSKPALQLHMSFRCTDSVSRDFSLVKVSMEKMAEAPAEEATAEPVAAAAWTSRMQQMEQEMQEALSKLNAAAAAIAAAPPPPPPAPPPTATPLIAGQTLFEVLAWLCTQNRVPVALLRQKLLPLDLMPSAVIDDINERAFDVAGEAALDEAEDTVTVQRGVLLQVLAAW